MRYEVTVKDTRGPPDCGPGPAGLDLLRPALLHRLYLRPRGNPCGGSGRSGARHLLGSKRHHSPGNCVPCLSHGSAYGGGVAAGKAPGPALYHSGLDLRISQTKTAPTLKKRRGCSYMCQERRAAFGNHPYHAPAHGQGPERGQRHPRYSGLC